MQRAGATNRTARVATLVEERVKRGDLLQNFGGVAVFQDFFSGYVIALSFAGDSAFVHHPALAGSACGAKQIEDARLAGDAGTIWWKIKGGGEAPWMLRIIDEALEVVDRDLAMQRELAVLGVSLLLAGDGISGANGETAGHDLAEC